MTGFWLGVVVSLLSGLLVNECCDLAPWAAAKVVRSAARIWHAGDPGQAEIYEEEWTRVIEDAPGKLTKLLHASGFWGGALVHRTRKSRALTRAARRAERHAAWLPVSLSMVASYQLGDTIKTHQPVMATTAVATAALAASLAGVSSFLCGPSHVGSADRLGCWLRAVAFGAAGASGVVLGAALVWDRGGGLTLSRALGTGGALTAACVLELLHRRGSKLERLRPDG
jgi:hypothetical protein